VPEFHGFAGVALGFDEVGPFCGQGNDSSAKKEEENDPAPVPEPWSDFAKHFNEFSV